MLKLAKAGATPETLTALTTSETTRSFSCIRGTFLVKFDGDFDAGTLTLQVSADGPNGAFSDYYAEDATGTPAVVQFTSADDQLTHLFAGHGQCFRFQFNGTGTPSLNIYVSGAGVVLH